MPSDVAYRHALVTFVDILGFRELVMTRPASEVRRIVHQVQRFGNPAHQDLVDEDDAEDDSVPRTQTFAFSDSIIRARPYDSNLREGSLFLEVISLVHMQAELADLGVFVRGGLTVGQVYFEENTIFGPAFIRAYELESQFANVPRIVVDPLVFQEMRINPQLWADHHDLEDEIHYQKTILARSDDGIWFVDYLAAIAGELDNPEYYAEFLAKHRNFIINNSMALTPTSRTLQKYLWLATYHNKVVGDSPIDLPSGLLITRDDIPALETMPEISSDIREH